MRGWRSAGLWVGAFIVGFTLLVAIFAPMLSAHDPFAQELSRRLIPPIWMEGGKPEHWLGTDQLGRDYLARLVYGARISMLIGIMTVVTSGLIGISLGVAGGFFGGRIDDVILFIITARLSIPLILVALAVVSLVGSSLTVVVATLGLLLWERFAVVARVATMQVRNLDYVAAAWSAGCSQPYIVMREILPNILSPVIVVATFRMAHIIIAEASLSFLGLGVQPPTASWGSMVADGRAFLLDAWWVSTFPGLAILALVLAINVASQGLRDAFDPRLAR